MIDTGGGSRLIFKFFRRAKKRKPRIVYEDDHIIAVFYRGSSKHLMITFGDKVTLAQGVRFFGDKPLMASGSSTLGIMAKAPHWYPEASIRNLLNAIKPLVAPFSERVGYGGSMGGYAVLKYAAWFDLSTVISLCPQFSIDNADLNGLRSVFSRFFDQSLAGMAVKNADRSGKAFVFFDPSHREDAAHAALIQGVWPDVRQVRVWMVGHGVTSTFAGSRNLAQLIDACRRDDLQALQRFAGLTRRSGHQRLNRLAVRLLIEKPDLTMKYLVPTSFSAGHWKNDQIREIHKRQRIRMLELLSRRDVERFQDYDTHLLKAEFNRIKQKKRQFWSEKMAASHFAGAESASSNSDDLERAIRTNNGTVLAFDFLNLRMVHLPIEVIRCGCRTVGLTHLDAAPRPIRLQVLVDGEAVALSALNNGTFLGLSPERRTGPKQEFQIEELSAGTGRLRHPLGYLSARADGHICIKSGAPGEAERFRFQANPDPA